MSRFRPLPDGWLPLCDAPRDGTEILIAVGPSRYRPGFVTLGRWYEPAADETISRARRALNERFGGYWCHPGNLARPFLRSVLAWQPRPVFPFDPPRGGAA